MVQGLPVLPQLVAGHRHVVVEGWARPVAVGQQAPLLYLYGQFEIVACFGVLLTPHIHVPQIAIDPAQDNRIINELAPIHNNHKLLLSFLQFPQPQIRKRPVIPQEGMVIIPPILLVREGIGENLESLLVMALLVECAGYVVGVEGLLAAVVVETGCAYQGELEVVPGLGVISPVVVDQGHAIAHPVF